MDFNVLLLTLEGNLRTKEGSELWDGENGDLKKKLGQGYKDKS